MLEGRSDTGRTLTEGNHFDSPLDGGSLGLESLAKDAISVILRKQEEVIIGTRDSREVDMDEKFSFPVDVAAGCVVANAHEVVSKAAQLEFFEGARLDADGARSAGGAFFFIDDPDRNAEATQLENPE